MGGRQAWAVRKRRRSTANIVGSLYFAMSFSSCFCRDTFHTLYSSRLVASMSLLLEYHHSSSIPLEVEGITPDVLREKSLGEIEQMPAFEGNRKGVLADFFKISGDLADGRMVWEGDLSGVHWLGAHMREGEMLIRGPAGRHVGSE